MFDPASEDDMDDNGMTRFMEVDLISSLSVPFKIM